jgi:hypothetical protein
MEFNMIVLTKAQRRALKRVYDRGPIFKESDTATFRREFRDKYCTPLTYRQFRRTVHSGYDCVMVHWCGMWLGIEPDGYTHS